MIRPVMIAVGLLGLVPQAPPPRLTGDWQARTGDEILGDGVWQVYGMKIAGDKLTISGGDLEKPVTLRRLGPPTARPDTLTIPDPPAPNQRAW